MTKLKRIAPNCYVDLNGRHWARGGTRQKRWWKLLRDAAGNPIYKRRDAVAAAQSATRPESRDTFAPTADNYIACGCLTNKHKWQPGSKQFQTDEKRHVDNLKRYFATVKADDRRLENIQLHTLLDIYKWRTRDFDEGRGARAYTKDAQTLSNVLNFAVFITKQIKFNPIHSNRPRLYTIKSTARMRMPENAEAIHRQAEYFLDTVESEVFAWMNFFGMFTGCRTDELRRLRLDARRLNAKDFEPGHIANGYLYLGRRSKGGVNPWCPIGAEMAEMIECFLCWHRMRFPKNPYFFPSPFLKTAIGRQSHGHALTRACRKLGMPHNTPHGLRAYQATKRLREGETTAQVAAAIGDLTAGLISTTYADNAGGELLHYRPKEGMPAWLRWQEAARKVVNMR